MWPMAWSTIAVTLIATAMTIIVISCFSTARLVAPCGHGYGPTS
ncbi:hypothetical protein AKJ09_01954 [Labilithrix luteola]|uniref:Uncharacterized protein n=1 Tax=Labilithrix luteola TaxID=1391654 RepID=A0A0K1PP28_9BACT|nr:hypothetical protein AKJ09_01954 [Labilithrix luteola]